MPSFAEWPLKRHAVEITVTHHYPHTKNGHIPEVGDFVTALTRADKTSAWIKTMTEATYGDKTLKRNHIYDILQKVKDG